jgi:hypothetical protein
MGVYGTDLEPRMIEYSQTNLDWFIKELGLQNRQVKLKPATQPHTNGTKVSQQLPAKAT